MYTLIDYHIPEAIQIRVRKEAAECDLNGFTCLSDSCLECHFCVDPQVTSYSTLQSLLVTAFHLQWYLPAV